MGRPVILARTNLGLKVEHLKDGYVLEKANSEAIAAAVIVIKQNKEIAEKLASGSVDFYLNYFASVNSGSQLKDYYMSFPDKSSDKNLTKTNTPGTITPSKTASHPYINLTKSYKNQGLVTERKEELQKQLESDLTLVPCIEAALEEKKLPKSNPWIGFVNAAPARLPGWLTGIPPYNAISSNAIFNSDDWKECGTVCRGLFVQSSDHADRLSSIPNVPVHPLRLPLPEIKKKWSGKAFEANPNKKIIQVGWWMQRAHAIYILPVQNMEKVWIKGTDPALDNVLMTEQQQLMDRHILFDFMLKSVRIIKDPEIQEYEQLLSENIVFAHYYDAINMDLLLTCIAGHTPILVNPHSSIREYLGNDYPLYYYSYNDAAEKASDPEQIRKGSEHLHHLAKKYDSEQNNMAEKIKNLVKGTSN
jgi:hypothetical protein